MAANGKRSLLLGTTDGLYRTNGGNSPELLGFKDAGAFRAPVVQDCRDPGTLYAGSTRVGMHRSRDGGRTWQEINRGIIYKNVWAIAQHPGTGTLFAGTSPADVYRSTDGGDSWTQCERLGQLPTTKGWHGPVPPHISRMKGFALQPDDPNLVYGAIEEGWAVRSLDGGATWEQIADGIDHDGHWIVLMPQPNTVVASTGAGMYRSEDGGLHWSESNTGLDRRYTAAPIAVHPARPETLLTGVTAVGPGMWRRPEGADSGFARSDDGGRTWRVSTKGLPQPCVAPPRALAAGPDSPDTFYAGLTDGTVWLSEDGGESFAQLLGGLPAVMSIAAMR